MILMNECDAGCTIESEIKFLFSYSLPVVVLANLRSEDQSVMMMQNITCQTLSAQPLICIFL